MRAHVVIYGRSQIEAVEIARVTRTRFAQELPIDVSCWPAVYRGIDTEVRRHCAVFIVAFAANADGVREQLDALVASL